MSIEKKEFTYNTDLISENEFYEHMILYKNYVNKTNEIWDSLTTRPYSGDEYRGLKELETFNLNGVKLHELYFENIGRKAHDIPSEIKVFFETNFQNFNPWRDDFTACCKAAKGWCIFGYDTITKTFRNILLDTHNQGLVNWFYPICVCDLYEHAYWMDYGTEKSKYIENFIHCINWNVVQDRIYNIVANM